MLLDRDANYQASIFSGDRDSVRTSLLGLLELAVAVIAAGMSFFLQNGQVVCFSSLHAFLGLFKRT